jgi:hypothetical protein
MTGPSAGARFRAAVAAEKPLQVPGAICAYHAILAERSVSRALYLSGGGVSAGSLGVPDLGISNLDDVLDRRAADHRRLPAALWSTPTPGRGRRRSTSGHRQAMIKAGAGAMHIEDRGREAMRPPAWGRSSCRGRDGRPGSSRQSTPGTDGRLRDHGRARTPSRWKASDAAIDAAVATSKPAPT